MSFFVFDQVDCVYFCLMRIIKGEAGDPWRGRGVSCRGGLTSWRGEVIIVNKSGFAIPHPARKVGAALSKRIKQVSRERERESKIEEKREQKRGEVVVCGSSCVYVCAMCSVWGACVCSVCACSV